MIGQSEQGRIQLPGSYAPIEPLSTTRPACSTTTLSAKRCTAAGVLHGCILDFTPSYVEAIRAFLEGMPSEQAAVMEQLWLTPPEYTDGDYAGVTAPLLVLNGDDDEFTSVDEQRALHHRLRGSELILMAGTGHGFPADLDAYGSQIVDFIERRRG